MLYVTKCIQILEDILELEYSQNNIMEDIFNFTI
jgi:hypothetical protein